MQNCGIRESGARQGSPTRCRHERRHRCAHTDEELHRLWDGVLAHRGHDVADMIVLRPSRLVTRDGDSGGYGGGYGGDADGGDGSGVGGGDGRTPDMTS